MEVDTAYWNRYEIGKAKFINDRRHHPCRQLFVEWANKNANSVIEIGPGECIEATQLHCDYLGVDIADIFLSHAKSLGLRTRKCEMQNIGLSEKKHDVVYCCSVMEHSPDIGKTICEWSKVSKGFYLTMFKWHWSNNELKAKYYSSKKRYSTSWPIYTLIELIGEFGVIKEKFLISQTGERYNFSEYSIGKTGENRNGTYLTMRGIWY